MNDGNSITGGANPRRTLTKLKTNVHTRRTVARTRPDQCQECCLLECHGRSMKAAIVGCKEDRKLAETHRFHDSLRPKKLQKATEKATEIVYSVSAVLMEKSIGAGISL